MSRVHYPECRVTVAASDEREAFECDDAEVWIEGDLILVSYFDDEGIVVLEGRPRPEGGYTLSARSRPRRAFLAPVDEYPGSYAGEIEEHGETSPWSLVFGEPATA